MNEQAIFEAALEIDNPAKRAAFIEKACAGNVELLDRVDSLLKSHESAGSFLEVPAVPAPKADTARPVDRTMDFAPKVDTSAEEEKEEDREVALSFLQPSTKPGSLGVLGHYEILQILGQGGFGIVFKAFDEKLHRLVAIKVMSPQLAATSPPRKRFQRETRAAAAIKHENIVQVYSVEEQPLPYLVMEYIDGQTLAEKLDGIGPLEITEVLHLARQIASGLAAAHEKGLIHRDIKPGNILLEAGAEQKVKITDFGLARVADDASMTRTGTIAGTPLYMAPEQATGKTLDHRSDLFSFGSVLYQMTSGRAPFRAPTTIAVLRRVAEDTPRPLRDILPEIPTWLAAIVDKLLKKSPDERYQTAKEVADLLGRCQTEWQQTGQVTCVPNETPPEVSVPRQERPAHSTESGAGSSVGLWLMGSAVCAIIAAVVGSQFLGGQLLGRRGSQTSTSSDSLEKTTGTPDRRAAEWALSVSGSIVIQHQNQLRAIQAVNELPKDEFELTQLNLRHNPKANDEGVAHCKGCKHLTLLEISSGTLTDQGLSNFKESKNLETVLLPRNLLSDTGMAYLADCKKLKVLQLDFTKVTDVGMVHFKNCKSLITLGLGETRVGDAGLANFKNCPDLLVLGLSNLKRVTDEGVANFHQCHELQRVFLSGTKVTDQGVEPFAGCVNLVHLDVTNTQVTEACVKKLAGELPACKIEWNGGVIEPTILHK